MRSSSVSTNPERIEKVAEVIQLVRTGMRYGPSRQIETPSVVFHLRTPLLSDSGSERLHHRVSTLLHELGLSAELHRQPSCVPDDDAVIGHEFGALVVCFQQAADATVSQYVLLPGVEAGEIQIVVGKEDYDTAFYAGELAVQVLNAAFGDQSAHQAKLDTELRSYFDFAAGRMLDPNARLVMEAARGLGIPVQDFEQQPMVSTRPPNPINHGLLQLGLCSRQHRFLASMPHGAARKVSPWVYQREALMRVLRAEGVPVPTQDLEFPNLNRYSRVLRAAERIGFPVVLKRPRTGEFHDALPASRVMGPIRDAAQLEAAFESGFAQERAAWVESYVPGAVYRFLILNSEVVSVVRLGAPTVRGDGATKLRSLLAAASEASDSLRDRMLWRSLLKDRLTEHRVAAKGFSFESVPTAGTSSELDFPGVAFTKDPEDPWLERMPNTFQAQALRATAACGLDYAGVDMVINDLGGPSDYPNAAVISVRPEPDLFAHVRADPVSGGRVAERLVRQWFPTREHSRVPIVAITGTNGKTTTSRMMAAIFRKAGKCTGLTCSDGVYVDDTLLTSGDLAGITGSLLLFPRQDIEALVLETARGGLITMGRSFDTCDVGVCLNIAADHLGKDGIHTLDEIAVVKRQVLENTHGVAVLNADDPRCVAMAEFSSAQALILFSGVRDSETISGHVVSGGRAVYLEGPIEDQEFVYFDGETHSRVLKVREISATLDGKAVHNVSNAAAAIAAACGVGLPLSDIRAALMEFRMGFSTTPGRMNELSGRPFRVIMDAAHNLHGLQALMAYIEQQSVPGRRMVVFGASKRFPEEQVRDMARELATRFDHFFVKKYRNEERHTDCREPWRVLHDELERSGIHKDAIQQVLDPMAAVEVALRCIEPGDLLLVLVPAGGALDSGVWQNIERLTDMPR